MYDNLTKDNKLVSFSHQQFYILECNTFVKLKSVVEDIYFFRKLNKDYKFDEKVVVDKSRDFSCSFEKNRNEFLYFYDYDPSKAGKYLDDLIKTEIKCDANELMKLEGEMGKRLFSPREGFNESVDLRDLGATYVEDQINSDAKKTPNNQIKNKSGSQSKNGSMNQIRSQSQSQNQPAFDSKNPYSS